MNKKLYLLPLLLLAFVFTSCEETKEVGRYDNWQVRGEMFIDSIANVAAAQTEQTPDSEKIYRVLNPQNLEYIYYKKNVHYPATLPEVSPNYTDSVDTYYRFTYFNGDLVQETFKGQNPDPAIDNITRFNVNEVIQGWTWALQAMRQGERWMLYIPAASGYGSGTGPNNTLRANSALVYDMQLVKIAPKEK